MRSKFEKLVASLLRKAKIKFKYEPYKIPYILKCDYNPDFVISKRGKPDILIEVKGHFKPQDRRKMKAVKQSNPDLDIRFWFMRDNYLTKSKKKRYSCWAKQHNFPFHVGDTLPKEWFKK